MPVHRPRHKGRYLSGKTRAADPSLVPLDAQLFPHLANDIADYFGLNTSDLVLDPFSGVGTVPLCMKHKGIPACSIEINPYLFFVGTVKTRTYGDVPEIADCFERFGTAYRRALRN